MTERSGSVVLDRGRFALHLKWFNLDGESGLNVEIETPSAARQPIPSSMLLRSSPKAGTEPEFLPGLDYKCFEGSWERLPNFAQLNSVKSGITPNFDLALATRAENVGLEFSGYLEIQESGRYTFHLVSDDGSQLFLANSPPTLIVTGQGHVPVPRPLPLERALRGEDAADWSEAEGEMTFLGRRNGWLEFDLAQGKQWLPVRILDHQGEEPFYLVNSRIRACGLGMARLEGAQLTSTMVVPGWEQIQVLSMPDERWSEYAKYTVSQLLKTNLSGLAAIVRAEGKIEEKPGEPLRLTDGTGSLAIRSYLCAMPRGIPVELIGNCAGTGTEKVLDQVVFREASGSVTKSVQPLTSLTSAEQVRQLTRTMAARGHPVKIEGTLIWLIREQSEFVIHDSSQAVYAKFPANDWPVPPEVGGRWEIEGVSDPGEFAPLVTVTNVRYLGTGSLPEPIRPTRDQLINGSLDSQYIELEGIVTSATTNQMTLFSTLGGVILALPDHQAPPLKQYEDARVRIRGCLFPPFDYTSHQVDLRRPITLVSTSCTVDAPPPLNPFDTPGKTIAELLAFDPEASGLQRVSVVGQITHRRAGTYYAIRGTNGFRFESRSDSDFEEGDVVQVVGFLDLTGMSPLIQEARVRLLGHNDPPPPRELDAGGLLQEGNDAALVSLKATLVGIRDNGMEQEMQFQIGPRTFIARMPEKPEHSADFAPGSRAKVTGVYSGQGSRHLDGWQMNSFEILLRTPADVVITARPPWWTLRRLLLAVGVLFGGLSLALVWAGLLRRQVARRTEELKVEIHQRELAQRNHALEEQRSRIARDLHDDLGSAITEISMLALSGPGEPQPTPEALSRLKTIGTRCRSIVQSLDELVWALNPRNDTLASLTRYIASATEDYLAPMKIQSRLQVPSSFPSVEISAETRHNLLLAVKESLANVVRHADASEVSLRIVIRDGSAEFIIRDNGRGFDPSGTLAPGADGLANLRERMRSVQGSCRIDSAPGRGTTIFLALPLHETTTLSL